MKLLKLYLPAFISLGLILSLAIIFVNEQKSKEIDNQSNIINFDYTVETEEKDNNEIETYNDYIYTYNLTNIYIVKQNTKVDLKDKVNDNPNFLNDLITNLKLEKTYDGATLYISNDNNFTNNILKIIKCNNGSYIIGNNELNYKDNLCV